jgi:hypothetical protein
MREQLCQDILTARLRANAERRDNPVQAAAWDAEADDLERRLILMEKRGEWDILADNRHG